MSRHTKRVGSKVLNEGHAVPAARNARDGGSYAEYVKEKGELPFHSGSC